MVAKIKCAMLIDDEEIDQKQYKRVLKRSGLVEEVITFSYADEAFEHLKDNPNFSADVIFLDINMPRMDGFEFLEKVTQELGRKITAVVIIMLTTSLNPRDGNRAHSFELVRDFVDKPLETSDVENAARLLTEVRGY